MPCFNGLSDEQQKRVVEWGNLPFAYEPAGTLCENGAEVGVYLDTDEYPGPRYYCRNCAIDWIRRSAVEADLNRIRATIENWDGPMTRADYDRIMGW